MNHRFAVTWAIQRWPTSATKQSGNLFCHNSFGSRIRLALCWNYVQMDSVIHSQGASKSFYPCHECICTGVYLSSARQQGHFSETIPTGAITRSETRRRTLNRFGYRHCDTMQLLSRGKPHSALKYAVVNPLLCFPDSFVFLL